MTGNGPVDPASVSDVGSSTLLAFGGTPRPGLAVAGAFRVTTIDDKFRGAPSGSTEFAEVFNVHFGPLVDWFPADEGGWHVGAMIGIGITHVGFYWSSNLTGAAPEGTVLGGYDFWIGPDWSLGALLIGSASTKATFDDEDNRDIGFDMATYSLGLELSLLRN